MAKQNKHVIIKQSCCTQASMKNSAHTHTTFFGVANIYIYIYMNSDNYCILDALSCPKYANRRNQLIG